MPWLFSNCLVNIIDVTGLGTTKSLQLTFKYKFEAWKSVGRGGRKYISGECKERTVKRA